MRHLTLVKVLKSLPTVCGSQCCHLKIETPTYRVWLCSENLSVTVEQLNEDTGRWEMLEGHGKEVSNFMP